MHPITKTCTRCHINKPLDEFPYHPTPKSKKGSRCKVCLSEVGKATRNAMSDQEQEEYKLKRRQDYHDNKIQRQAKHREWLSLPENMRRALAKARQYKMNNRDSINAQRRNQRSTDPTKRLADLVRTRVRDAVIYKGSRRSYHFLGCSYEEFRRHIESKLKPGMSWDNYGYGRDRWQIDHIRPICSFNMLDPIEQEKALHYTNCQPMWYDEHVKKSAVDVLECRRIRTLSTHDKE